MKIKLKIGSTWVIDGREMREQPSDWRVNGQPVRQPAHYLRASAARIHDRGNVNTVITFTCAKEHANEQEAALYCVEHYLAMFLTGTAEFSFIRDSGAAYKYYMPNVSCNAAPLYQVGATTFSSYTVSGGLPQKDKP